MKSSTEDVPFDFGRALRLTAQGSWRTPEDIQLVAQLRQIAIKIARKHLDDKPTVSPPGYLDAEDLAGEFLLVLRKKGNWLVRSESGLVTEYRRWVTRFSSPAHYELWETVSAALHELARAGTAWRLDATAEEANKNDAIWTSVPGERGRQFCNLVDFENAARHVGSYPLPAARRQQGERTVKPKVISPKDAQELTLSLLNVAGGAIRLCDLIEEFKRHVFVLVIGPLVDPPEANVRTLHPGAIMRLFDLAYERAALVWAEVSEAEATDLLCNYFIANYVEERRVSLDEFGDPRRVHERLQRVIGILRNRLALDVNEALDVESEEIDTNLHSRFVVEAMHNLREKCGGLSGEMADPMLPIKQSAV